MGVIDTGWQFFSLEDASLEMALLFAEHQHIGNDPRRMRIVGYSCYRIENTEDIPYRQESQPNHAPSGPQRTGMEGFTQINLGLQYLRPLVGNTFENKYISKIK